MHHSFIDKYSDLTSPLHRCDVHAKIIISLVLLIGILATPATLPLLLVGFATLILVAWLTSRVPFSHLAKRLGLALPFIVLIAVGTLFAGGAVAPWHRFAFIVAKAALAIAVLTLLTSTTRFPALLKGFEQFGMPRLIASMLAFLYRYLFILIDEFERLSIGRRSRELTKNRSLTWRGRAYAIGTLFLRSLERSERVYAAMKARGFNGHIRAYPGKDHGNSDYE